MQNLQKQKDASRFSKKLIILLKRPAAVHFENYRTIISLLSRASKILNRIFYNRIENIIEEREASLGSGTLYSSEHDKLLKVWIIFIAKSIISTTFKRQNVINFQTPIMGDYRDDPKLMFSVSDDFRWLDTWKSDL